MNNSKDFLKMDYIDLVFMNKNKAYGVYALKKSYNRTALYAMAIFIGAIGIAAGSSFISSGEAVRQAAVFQSEPDPIQLTDDTKLTFEKKQPEKLPESVTRKERATVRSTAPVIASRDQVQDDERNEDPNSIKNQNSDISDRNHEGENSPSDLTNPYGNARNGTDNPHTLNNNTRNVLDGGSTGNGGDIVLKVDEKAKPPKQYQDIINQNLRYPAMARANGIEGRVMVSFVVEADGSITDVRFEKDPGGGLGEEAVRVVRLLPKFTPALLAGKPVKSRFRIPISFSLRQI